MKIALCFSGLMRDVDETKQFWTELINKYKMDVYASFWDVENQKLNDTFKNFSEIYRFTTTFTIFGKRCMDRPYVV